MFGGELLEDIKRVIADNIALLRKGSGMTQIELAEKLNYSDKAISKWERGESVPDISVLKQIADMYGVTVDYLITPGHSGTLCSARHERDRGERGEGAQSEKSTRSSYRNERSSCVAYRPDRFPRHRHTHRRCSGTLAGICLRLSRVGYRLAGI